MIDKVFEELVEALKRESTTGERDRTHPDQSPQSQRGMRHSLDLSFGSGSEKDAITFVPKAVDFMNVIGKLPGTTFHGNSKLFGNGIRCQDD